VPRDPLEPHVASPGELRERLAAERRGTPFLLYRDGDDRQVIVELDAARTRLTIGRSARNDVALRWDAEVSRLHAELERIGADWVIGDDDLSHNGTFLNGSRVRARKRLRSGDLVTVGDSTIAFLAAGPASGSKTVTAGPAQLAVAVTPAQLRVLVALCRPLPAGGAPASNRQIADELVVAVDTVKATLGRLFEAFGIGAEVPQNQKRAMLARRALQSGVVRGDEP
jgi:pSer/pThr/pTyr-binding forkhead associated (FHA) protein